jgi:DNA-binding response OmpR family regulator
MESILYIEDNVQLAEIVKKVLGGSYKIDIALSAADGIALAKEDDYDLLIIDYYLGSDLGLDICTELRQKYEVHAPILFLTKNDCKDDVIAALDAGADDYVLKPFDMGILKARIRALTRRAYSVKGDDKLTIRGITMDQKKRAFFYRGRQLLLPKRAYLLLKYLFQHQGEVVYRDQLINSVWDGKDISSNTIDVHVTKIRNILEKETGSKFIDTVHGMGYRV